MTNIDESMLRWFGLVERMSDESRLTKGIYKADVCGNTGRGHPRRTNIDLIGEIFQKDQVRSTHNGRACVFRCMNVEEKEGSM